jgi:hypothetical protein
MPSNSREDPATPPGLRPPPMDHAIGGRKPSQYSDEMALIILARIRRGETMQQICADAANLGNFLAIKRRAAVVEKRMADMTPKVWRWDLPEGWVG